MKEESLMVTCLSFELSKTLERKKNSFLIIICFLNIHIMTLSLKQ